MPTVKTTPPKPAKEGAESLAWLEAMKLLALPFVLVLFVVTFFDASVHQFYFFWTGRYLEKGVGIPGNWVMPVMSVGQFAEIATMAFLGYCLKRLGWLFPFATLLGQPQLMRDYLEPFRPELERVARSSVLNSCVICSVNRFQVTSVQRLGTYWARLSCAKSVSSIRFPPRSQTRVGHCQV